MEAGPGSAPPPSCAGAGRDNRMRRQTRSIAPLSVGRDTKAKADPQKMIELKRRKSTTYQPRDSGFLSFSLCVDKKLPSVPGRYHARTFPPCFGFIVLLFFIKSSQHSRIRSYRRHEIRPNAQCFTCHHFWNGTLVTMT